LNSAKVSKYKVIGGVILQCKVIVNPAAGRGLVRKQIQQLLMLFTKSGLKFDMVTTRSPGHAIELARDAARDL